MNLDEQIYHIAMLESGFLDFPVHNDQTFCSRASYNLEITQIIQSGQILETNVHHNGRLVYSATGPNASSGNRKFFDDGVWTTYIPTWNQVVENKSKSFTC